MCTCIGGLTGSRLAFPSNVTDKFPREDFSRWSSHLMPFRSNLCIVCSIEWNRGRWKHPVMSLNSHTVPYELFSSHRGDRDTDQSKRTRNQTHNNSHFWFWPLRKAFRLWWRTFDLTNCTSTLYHHLDSSWHVPFTNVDRSGVWMRIELVWPVICSASATSITSSIILMLACGIVSGCGVSSKWVWLIRPILIPVSGSADLSLAWESSDKPDQFVLINTHAFINRISEFTIIKQNEPSALPPLEANQNLIKIPFILEAMDF